MMGTAARKATTLSETQPITRKTGNLAAKKIWLPKLLYNALPYFYFTSGIAAFLATLYISEWFWVLPHYFLFAAVCLHLGIVVYWRRNRKRAKSAGAENS